MHFNLMLVAVILRSACHSSQQSSSDWILAGEQKIAVSFGQPRLVQVFDGTRKLVGKSSINGFWCKTTAIVENEIVTELRYEGTACGGRPGGWGHRF